MRAQILLSTWNGAAHLREQLDSLVAQTAWDDCELIIRDDGSSDQTLEIVHAFAAAHGNVQIAEGSNLGVIASFGELMKLADASADIFFFCDQDDVWLPTKVEAAIDALRDHLGSDTPALYASRSIVTDAILNPIGETNEHLQGPSFRHALVQTLAPGHNMAFNAALLTLARENYPASELIMHDSWLYTIASGLGVVIFDRTTYCLYRTHGTNTLGYDTGGLAQLRARVQRVLGRDRSAYTRQAVAFDALFADRLDVDDRAALTGFAYSRKLTDRIAQLRAYPIVHETALSSAVASALYLAGRYRLR